MNIINLTNGSYNLVKENGETFVGENVNLLLITFDDTITIFDRVYKRVVPILNCLVTNITFNGKTYSNVDAFETDFKKAVESEGGGGDSGVKKVVLKYVDKGNSIVDEEGNTKTYNDIKTLLDDDKTLVYLIFERTVGSALTNSVLWPGINGDYITFVGANITTYGRLDRVSIRKDTNTIITDMFIGEQVENKVDELGSDSTYNQYPSAKGVVDYVETKVTPKIFYKFLASGSFERSVVTGNETSTEIGTYETLKDDLKVGGAFISFKDDVDTLVNPEFQLLPAQFDDTNHGMDIFLVGYVVGRYNYTVSVKSDDSITVVKTPYNNIWNGTEDELPETQQPGVLYLVNE